MEAAAVNLVAGDKPADVYSEIALRYINSVDINSVAVFLRSVLSEAEAFKCENFQKFLRNF